MPYKDLDKRKEYDKARPNRKRPNRRRTSITLIQKLWYGARARARDRGLDFNITQQDIVIPDHCPILNIKLEPGIKRIHDGSPSLDRIDNRLGYIKGNIAVISYKANRYKSDLTASQLLALYTYMVKNQKA